VPSCRDLAGTPITRVQLGRLLGERFPGVAEEALAYAFTYLEPAVQPPPRGVWGRRGPVLWQTFRGWLGVDADEPLSIDDVVLRYLAAFGPASVADLRVWSGLSGLREVTDRLAPTLRVFIDEQGRQLLDLPEAPRPDGDIPDPVRFLPEYDNVLLSHDDRSRFIPDGRRVPLPPGTGARAGTVLIDGDFRATWTAAVNDEGVVLSVRASPRLSSRQADEVDAEGGRLLGLIASGKPGRVAILEG
jgi:Winged helix DNA-binding domain